MNRTIRDIALLMGLSFAMFAPGMGAPLLEPQEARYAAIASEMLRGGDWITPHLFGDVYLDKPPMFYWLTAGSFAVFGEREAAARFVPALAAILTTIVVYGWGCRVVGPVAALWSAVILTLCGRYVFLTRLVTFDGLLTLFITTSLAAGHLAMQTPRRIAWWWLGSGIAAGLGVSTKGPIAIVLTLVPLVIWQCAACRRWPAWRHALIWMSAVVAVNAPWFVVMESRQPGFLQGFLWHHHVERFANPFDHAKPWWFYLPEIIAGSLPWSLIAAFAVHQSPRSRNDDGELNQRLFFVLSAGWVLLFFSLAGCKRATYILPAFPPMAMLIGSMIQNWRPADNLIRSATVVVCFAGMAMGIGAIPASILNPAAGIGIATFFAMASALALVRARSMAHCAGATIAVLLAGVALAWPGYARKFSLHEMATTVRQEPNIVFMARSWDSLEYYLKREVPVISENQLHEQPAGTVVIASARIRLPATAERIAQHGGLVAVRLAPVSALRR